MAFAEALRRENHANRTPGKRVSSPVYKHLTNVKGLPSWEKGAEVAGAGDLQGRIGLELLQKL
jgi:hypothetical protein